MIIKTVILLTIQEILLHPIIPFIFSLQRYCTILCELQLQLQKLFQKLHSTELFQGKLSYNQNHFINH